MLCSVSDKLQKIASLYCVILVDNCSVCILCLQQMAREESWEDFIANTLFYAKVVALPDVFCSYDYKL